MDGVEQIQDFTHQLKCSSMQQEHKNEARKETDKKQKQKNKQTSKQNESRVKLTKFDMQRFFYSPPFLNKSHPPYDWQSCLLRQTVLCTSLVAWAEQ